MYMQHILQGMSMTEHGVPEHQHHHHQFRKDTNESN